MIGQPKHAFVYSGQALWLVIWTRLKLFLSEFGRRFSLFICGYRLLFNRFEIDVSTYVFTFATTSYLFDNDSFFNYTFILCTSKYTHGIRSRDYYRSCDLNNGGYGRGKNTLGSQHSVGGRGASTPPLHLGE